jgi:hypothetical protein
MNNPFQQLGLIHEHHQGEEEFLFIEYKKKLGQDSMIHNVDQHATFVPQVEGLVKWIKDVQSDKCKYDGTLMVEKIHSFSDILVEHLVEVGSTIHCCFRAITDLSAP